MTALATVDVVGRILALAANPPVGASPEVTGVRVDDVELAIDVLEPALRHVGGSVLDIRHISEEGCAETASDDAQEAAICAALTHAAAAGARELRFAYDEHGRRRAFWADELAAGATSPSEHPLLGLATATIDERLTDSGNLVAVVYDEALLEPFERPLAWRYATQVMAPRVSGSLDHLVVVAATERPEDYHLRGDPSVRWSIDGLRVAQRNRPATNRVLTHRIAASSGGHVVLFLAAGFSTSMGMPLGNKMRDFALRKLLPNRSGVADADLPREFYALVGDQFELLDFEIDGDPEQLARHLTFERVLREELRAFRPSPTFAELQRLEAAALSAAPIGAVRHLHAMLRRTRKLVLVTVNFDRLIEHRQDSYVEVFADDATFARCAEYLDDYLTGAPRATKVPVLKLHGSFASQATLIATIDQTLTGLTSDKAAALDRACEPGGGSPVPFVYVGSSMRDLDVGLQLAQPRFAEQLDEEWIMPLPAATLAQFVSERRVQPWRRLGARDSLEQRLISWTADEFLHELAGSWT